MQLQMRVKPIRSILLTKPSELTGNNYKMRRRMLAKTKQQLCASSFKKAHTMIRLDLYKKVSVINFQLLILKIHRSTSTLKLLVKQNHLRKGVSCLNYLLTRFQSQLRISVAFALVRRMRHLTRGTNSTELLQDL